MNTPRRVKPRVGELVGAENFDFNAFDEQLNHTIGVDVFCSSSRWAESARHAFKPHAPLIVYRQPNCSAIFTPTTTPDGLSLLVPLDSTWMLGSPIASPNPGADVDGLVAMLLEDRAHTDFALFSGIAHDSVLFRALLSSLLVRRARISLAGQAERCVANIEDGVDAWLDRRSAKFRASIRRSLRSAGERKLHFVPIPMDAFGESLFRTFLELENRSWKGAQGTGISEASMAAFCRGVMQRTRPEGMTRGVLAFDGTQVVGFAFGAVMDGRYRGVQMSYDARYRDDGLGNCIQIALMKQLADEGVRLYDLGSTMPYKTRWADYVDATTTIVVNLT